MLSFIKKSQIVLTIQTKTRIARLCSPYFSFFLEITLIIIGSIVDFLKTLVALKKAVLKKKELNGFCPMSGINPRINWSQKMRPFIIFQDLKIST